MINIMSIFWRKVWDFERRYLSLQKPTVFVFFLRGKLPFPDPFPVRIPQPPRIAQHSALHRVGRRGVAEGVGFEPTWRLLDHRRFSKPFP